MHDPGTHAGYVEEFRRHLRAPVELHDLDLHINDDAFVDVALEVFDRWVAEGRIPAGVEASLPREEDLVERPYELDELVSRISLDNRHAEVDPGRPVGRENL